MLASLQVFYIKRGYASCLYLRPHHCSNRGPAPPIPSFFILLYPLLSRDNSIMSSPITPPTIRPGGFSSPPPIHACALPPPPGVHCVATSNSAFERFNPFLPRLQRSEVPVFGEPVFPAQLKPPPPCKQAKFLSPGPPKPTNEHLWKRGGGLRIVSVSLRVRNKIFIILTEVYSRCLLGLLSPIHHVGQVWWVSVLSSLFHKQRNPSLRPFQYTTPRHSKLGVDSILVVQRIRLDRC